MKKNELKGTKADLDPTLNNAHGGKRSGSGRKKKFSDVSSMLIPTPLLVLEAMGMAGITNKTRYVNYLIANDLKKRLPKKQINKELKEVFEIIFSDFEGKG